MTTPYPLVDAESTFYWPDVDPTDTVGVNGNAPMTLTDDEQQILGALKRQLNWAKRTNRIKNEYYELKQRVRDLEIAVPPQLKDVGVVVGWPGTVVDVLEERIDLMAFTSTGNLYGLDEVYEDNSLDLEFSRSTADCLITGISFYSVGKGDTDAGEPEVLVTAESPNAATVIWDYRKRRAAAGLSQTYDTRNKVIMQSLYMPDRTITWAVDPGDRNKSLGITAIDAHNLNRVMLVRQINRDRATDIHGRSEISRAIRYYTDAAVRTMLGMELNREFYTTPMRTALDVFPASIGITEDMSDDEKRKIGWSMLMGHMNFIPPQGDDSPMQQPRPQIIQFPANPPTPYIDQVKAYSIQVSAESGMPASMLGFVTDNPTSADSIDKSEYRLIRRAERRIQSYRQSCKEIALCSVLVRDGAEAITLDDLRQIEPEFRDPSMPTRAAAADAAQKLVAAEILPPRSRVTWTKLGISPKDQDQLEIDWRKAKAEQLAEQMQQQSMQQQQAEATARIQARAQGTGTPTPSSPASPASPATNGSSSSNG
jgi:Phage portal protein, SPP1 Gp6-like